MVFKVGEFWPAVGVFQTGATVTIAVHDITAAPVFATLPLSSSATAEIGSTGVFVWPSTSLLNPITDTTHLVWIMTDNTTGRTDKRHVLVRL